MKYNKVTKEDVYSVIVGARLDVLNPIGGVINLVNIASILGTSRYQVKKYIKELESEGLVELTKIKLPIEDEPNPPYWGYRLTKKGESTEYFKGRDIKLSEWLKEINERIRNRGIG